MLYSRDGGTPAMADMTEPIEIPNRPLFKAAEVCELLKVQPYVLRTWEAEFRDLGVARGAGGARVYRREDVERAQRIKHLLLIEGLTLAGVRRKLEEEHEPPLDETLLPVTISAGARERILAVKQGLRSLLTLLADGSERGGASAASASADGKDGVPAVDEFTLAPLGAGERSRSAIRDDDAESERTRSPRRRRST